MQPYFFPYIGYFQLMNAVDQWVVFDTPQYIRHGWVNRNRVLKLGNEDWKYVRIPIEKAHRETPINQVRVCQKVNWRDEIFRNLDFYEQKKAPFFDQTISFIETATDCQSDHLSDVLVYSLRQCVQYLDISLSSIEVFSEMKVNIGPVNHAGQWALRISEAIGAETYINPEGGRSIFEPTDFDESQIELRFLRPDLSPYDQKKQGGFIGGLSIIDCLMWLGKEETRQRINDYSIVAA